MRVRSCAVVATLTLLLSASVGKATTYAIRSPLNMVEDIWLPKFIFQNIGNDGKGRIGGVVDGNRVLLPPENLVEFQIGVSELNSSDFGQSDMLATARRENEFMLIAKKATATGLFVEVESESISYAKSKHNSAKPKAVYCRDAENSECGGDVQRNSAAALLFSSRPNWSVYMVGSDCCSAKVWQGLLVERFLSPFSISFQGRTLSSGRVLMLRTSPR